MGRMLSEASKEIVTRWRECPEGFKQKYHPSGFGYTLARIWSTPSNFWTPTGAIRKGVNRRETRLLYRLAAKKGDELKRGVKENEKRCEAVVFAF